MNTSQRTTEIEMFNVEIVNFETREVVKSVKCETLSRAQKTESGMMINLNVEEYFTQIINTETGEEV